MKKILLVLLTATCLMITSMVLVGPTLGELPGELSAHRPTAGPVTFTNVSEEVGLSGVNGNHFSWGDMDNDGHEDLLVDGKRLFRNSGPPEFVFTEVTSHAGIASSARSGVWGDMDNDGWLDIFCGGGAPSSDHPTHPDLLWHNQKDGTFRRILPEEGAPWDTFPTVASGWADMDRDGFLDIYMVNYENSSLSGYPDHFWMNNGDTSFRNATAASGMSEDDHPYPGRGVSWCDYDMDGFMDAYVSNYRIMPNYLYRNLKNGTMEEISSRAGVEGHGNDHPVTREGPYFGHSLGSSWGDLDNDGDMDLWVTNLAHKDAWRGPICDDSYLFENLGADMDWTFVDRREGSGIPRKEIPGALGDGDELMVSSAMADYDNDGDLDLFIPQIYRDVSYAHSYLYRNDGDLTFTDVSTDSGLRVWNTYGSAWCDYNEDGWMDLITGGGVWDSDQGEAVHQEIHLFRNDGSGSHWLEVELEGRESNAPAIGARVEVRVDQDGDGENDLLCVREVQGGTAAQGQQDSMVLHFGLGASVNGLEVTTHWPMGRTTVESNLTPDTRVRLFEPTDILDLDLRVIGFEPSARASELRIEVQNPTDQEIDHVEMDIGMIGDDESRYETIVLDRSIGIGSGVHELDLPGWDEEKSVNITFSINRTYPPVSGNLKGSMFYDPLSNVLPVPGITGPRSGSANEELEFSGENSYDPDGSISGYLFDMGDGTFIGWTSGPRIFHSYGSPGNYTVRLSVKDDRGAISVEDAMMDVSITGDGPTPPRANILKVDPREVEIGEDVVFEGEGIPGPGARITHHEWTSSRDGSLSTRSTFGTDELSEGFHVIEFRVKDSSGVWSLPDKANLTVYKPVVEPLWVEISELPSEGPFSGVIEVRGSAGPLMRVERVEIRVDLGLWDKVWMTPEWKYRIDCSKLDEGTHLLEVRAYGDGQYSNDHATLEFEVEKNPLDAESLAEEDVGPMFLPEYAIYIVMAVVSLIFITVLVLLLWSGRRRSRFLERPRK
ncbi:MAG: FG-GAP-like repeat-containing protein [Thermoplasmatota archaeon]